MSPIAIILAGAALLGMPTTARTTRADTTWCHVASSPTDVTPYEDARFLPLRREVLKEAFDILEAREAVVLSGRNLRRFLSRQQRRGGKHYYLVRSAVYAPPSAGLRRAYSYVPSAHYQLYFTPDRTAVVVASQRAFARQVTAQNVPLILETSAEVNRLVVACYYVP